ncbi:alpha/beta fold hydrolase [Donghicola sp. XS_ASV15]|uniref:alpha/beta fold hydrolase n=1 Tax=Donghicola sp. XS_ASV15 TaxID=3241295 RepID=UPI003512283B
MICAEEQFADLPSGIRLCYTDEGKGVPILLIIGLGFQLVHWPRAFIDALIAAGYRVITFDNRDSGRSTYLDGPVPNLRQKLFRRAPPGAYDLGDMALDSVALMDHLRLDQAHIVGMSMGGMIAQTIAARHPERVASLTSIFSSTGAKKVGQPGLRMMLELSRKPATDRTAFIERRMVLSRFIGGKGFPADPEEARETFALSFDRGGLAQFAGTGRQIGAIIASGDRTAELAKIHAPTLVIHGDRDPLVHPSGGRATAWAINGARHETITGMGHEITAALAPRLSALITTHIREMEDPT